MYSTVQQAREYHQVRQEKVLERSGGGSAYSAFEERRGGVTGGGRPVPIDYEGYASRLGTGSTGYRSLTSGGTTLMNGSTGGATRYHTINTSSYMNGSAGGAADLSPVSKASRRTTQDFSESSSFDDRFDRKVLRKVKKTRSDRNRNLVSNGYGARSQSHQELRMTNGDTFAERSRLMGSAENLSRSFHADVDRLNEQLDVILEKIETLETRKSALTHADRSLVEDVVAELEAISGPVEALMSDVEGSRGSPAHSKAHALVMGLQQRRLAYLNKLGVLGAGIGLVINRGGRSVTTIEEEAEERYYHKATKVFRTCEDCTEWILEIMQDLVDMEFPSELEALEELLEKHRIVHRDVVDFRQEVDQNIARQAAVSAEDSYDYCDMLATLERNYEELREFSTGRMVDLDSLVAFVRLALLELGWISERVVPEVSRDWSDVNQLDLPVLENYYRQLLHEIELHEVQFNVAFNQGTALIRQEHPAPRVIEKYLAMMQREWEWLLSLAKCYEVHLQDSVSLKEILEEASKIDYWIDQQTKYLETKFERSTVTLEEGENLLRDLEEWKTTMDKYHGALVELLQRCENVSPMWQRGERITSPISVKALVDYEDANVSIRAGDHVQLLDNSDLVNWLVRIGGTQARVPSVVFRVPPPDARLSSLLDRLRVKFESLNKLWVSKHLHIRFLMFMSNCRTIRSWDLERFLSYTEEQRESIMKALNADGQRLLAELPEDDPLARRIREELRLANEHYARLLAESQKKKGPQPGEVFDEKGGNLLERLERFWKILNDRVHGPVPLRPEDLELLFKQHKGFEDQLEGTDNEVNTVKHLFGTIEDPSPIQQQRMRRIMELWENLWSVSKSYVQRLKSLEDLFVMIQEAESVLRQNESILVNSDPLPSDLEKLRNLQSRLLELQLVLQQKQSMFDQLSSVAASVRRSVAASRGSAHHTPDVDRLDDKVQAITVRWENLGAQVLERLKSVELGCQIIMSYRPAYDTELSWIESVEKRIKNLRRPEDMHPEELQHELERLMADYNTIKEHSRAIENVNHEGGRYIREGRTYDSNVKSFRERYSESYSFYSSGETPGADIVTRELEELNRRFARLPNLVMDRYKLIQMLLEKWRADLAARTPSPTPPLRPPSPPRRPPSPVLNIQRPQQIIEGTVSEIVTDFEEVRDRPDEALRTDHDDEMHMYEEWTETKVQFYELEAVLHKQTGEILTFVEALRQGLLDLRSGSGEFFDLVSGSKISLEEAVNRGFISQSFQECLNTDYGIRDPRTAETLTLLQAIQRRIYDPECRQLRDPVSGDLLSMEDAVFKKVISFQDVHRLVKMGILKLPPVSLENAMENKMIDLETGMFRGRVTHESIPLREALRNEYITLSNQLPPMIACSLSEAILDRFIDLKTGEFRDKNTGAVVTLKQATGRFDPLLNKNVKEIVDTQDRKRISVGEAIVRNVIDPRNATYADRKAKHTLTLDEAYTAELIQRPLTLTEIVQKQLVDSQGRFVDPHTQRRLTLLEAINEGMVDADVEHIYDPDGEDVISVQEALERGVLDPVDCCLVTDRQGARLALIEAMREGHLRARRNHFLFDIRGFKNTKTFNHVSFTEAVDLGIIDLSSGRLIDLSADESFAMPDAVERGLVEPFVNTVLTTQLEMLPTPPAGNPTIFEAVCRGHIDYKRGVLRDLSTKAEYTSREAYDRGMLTLKGAMLLRAIFNVPPQLTIAPKVVRQAQYQRRKKKMKQSSGDKDKVKVTLEEAMRKGLIDAKTQRFRQGETEMSLQEALSQGMIDPQSEWIVPKSSPFSNSPAIQETVTEKVEETSEVLAPRRRGDTRNIDETVTTVRRGRTAETTAIGAPGGVAAYRAVGHGETGVFEVPADGWHIHEAEQLGYINLDTGMMSIPNTNKNLSLKQALGLNLIRSTDMQFEDSQNRERSSLYDAMLKGKVDATGHVLDIRTGSKMTLRSAVDSGVIRVAAQSGRQPGGKMRVLNFGVPSSTLSNVAGAGTASYEENQAAWSFDARTGDVFDGIEGDTISIDDALRRGRVPETSFRVRDPISGREMLLPDAVKWGVVESGTLMFHNQQDGQRYTLREAARRGWLRAAGPAADESPRNEATRTSVRTQTRKVTSSKEPPPSGPSIYLNTTLEELVEEADFNEFTGCFSHSNTGATFTLQEAVQLGYFNPYDVEVLDTQQNQRVPLLNAIQYGLVDTTAGLYIDKHANTTTQLKQALRQGLIRSRHGAVETVQAMGRLGNAAMQSQASPQSRSTHLSASGERRELIEVAPGKKVLVKVSRDASGSEKGEYVDEATGMKYSIALHGDPYASQSKTTVKSSSQVKQVELEPYAEIIGLDEVRDNRSGRVMTLAEAEKAGIVKTENKGRQVTKSYAVYRSNIQKALLEGVTNASTQERISLELAVREGIIDLNRLRYRNSLNGEFMSLTKAANAGLLDMTIAEVLPKGICDPSTGEMIPVEKALSLGLINSRTAEVKDSNGTRLTWLEVLRPVYASMSSQGIFDPRRGHHVPLVSGINEGLIDLPSETYKNPVTGERDSLAEAVRKNLLDEETLRTLTDRLIYDWMSKRNISLIQAIRDGIVNIREKTVRLGPDETERIAVAVQKGRFPKEVGEKLSNIGRWSFVEALGKGFIDLQANQFTDPDSDVTMTITDAIEAGYVKDLEGANGEDTRNLAVVVNASADFDESTGKIFDRQSNQHLSLMEATRRGVLDDQSLLYETDTGNTLTLREALDQGIFDIGGRYVCRQSGGAKIPLKQAVADGYLALIASPMQASVSVAEAVRRRDREGFRFRLEHAPDGGTDGSGSGSGGGVETTTVYKTSVRSSPRPSPRSGTLKVTETTIRRGDGSWI